MVSSYSGTFSPSHSCQPLRVATASRMRPAIHENIPARSLTAVFNRSTISGRFSTIHSRIFRLSMAGIRFGEQFGAECVADAG